MIRRSIAGILYPVILLIWVLWVIFFGVINFILWIRNAENLDFDDYFWSLDFDDYFWSPDDVFDKIAATKD